MRRFWRALWRGIFNSELRDALEAQDRATKKLREAYGIKP